MFNVSIRRIETDYQSHQTKQKDMLRLVFSKMITMIYWRCKKRPKQLFLGEAIILKSQKLLLTKVVA